LYLQPRGRSGNLCLYVKYDSTWNVDIG
jgi:hypothetical protein